MEKQPKAKNKKDGESLSQIYETIKDKGFIQELWLDIMSDIKEKPSYKRLKDMVEKVIEASVDSYPTKPKEYEERLKTRTIFTDLSIMTYTIDTLISQVLHKKLRDEFKSITSNIVEELKNKKHSIKLEDKKNNSVTMLENIGEIICNGMKESQTEHNEDPISTSSVSAMVNRDDSEGCKLNITDVKEVKSSARAGERSIDFPTENTIAFSIIETVPERNSLLNLTCSNITNAGSLNKKLKKSSKCKKARKQGSKISGPLPSGDTSDVDIMNVSDADNLSLDGSCSFESISSVHTSDLSSFEDDISISSEDEEGVKTKKHVSLKLANDLYVNGKLSDLYKVSSKQANLKNTPEKSPNKNSIGSPNKRSGRTRKPNSKYSSEDVICTIKQFPKVEVDAQTSDSSRQTSDSSRPATDSSKQISDSITSTSDSSTATSDSSKQTPDSSRQTSLSRSQTSPSSSQTSPSSIQTSPSSRQTSLSRRQTSLTSRLTSDTGSQKEECVEKKAKRGRPRKSICDDIERVNRIIRSPMTECRVRLKRIDEQIPLSKKNSSVSNVLQVHSPKKGIPQKNIHHQVNKTAIPNQKHKMIDLIRETLRTGVKMNEDNLGSSSNVLQVHSPKKEIPQKNIHHQVNKTAIPNQKPKMIDLIRETLRTGVKMNEDNLGSSSLMKRKRGRPPKDTQEKRLSNSNQTNSEIVMPVFENKRMKTSSNQQIELDDQKEYENANSSLKRKKGRPSNPVTVDSTNEEFRHSVESFSILEERLCLKDHKPQSSSPPKSSTKSYAASDLYKPRSDFRVSFNSRGSKALTLFSN